MIVGIKLSHAPPPPQRQLLANKARAPLEGVSDSVGVALGGADGKLDLDDFRVALGGSDGKLDLDDKVRSWSSRWSHKS
jgi:hypothetical protein